MQFIEKITEWMKIWEDSIPDETCINIEADDLAAFIQDYYDTMPKEMSDMESSVIISLIQQANERMGAILRCAHSLRYHETERLTKKDNVEIQS